MAAKKNYEGNQGGDRVFIFPTLQMNVINYREDEDLFKLLLKQEGISKLKLATGYFNLQQEFLDLLKSNEGLKTDILTSSPRSNGFYRAGRFKKYIPGMYRVNELNFLS